MIRLKIELPKSAYHTVIWSRDEVANLLIAAMKRHGFRFETNHPARWGFGVVATPVDKKKMLRRVGRVYVGSADPEIAAILAKIEPHDLVEPNAVAGCGLDLSMASITRQTHSLESEGIAFYCISPIRANPTVVTPEGLPEFGAPFNEALNLAMKHRFHRDFHLSFLPDSLYIRAKAGNITARMAHNTSKHSQSDAHKTGQATPHVLTKPGIITPFVLTGPKEEIDTVYFSGLGVNTGRGFGCVEVSV